MSGLGNRRHSGGVAYAMKNLSAIDRKIYLQEHGENFAEIISALTEYRRLCERALGAHEQYAADAWLLNELRTWRGSLEVLFAELPE